MSALGLSVPEVRTDLERRVLERLATVQDPEIRRPITDLGMVESVVETAPGVVEVAVLLTIAACPLRGTIQTDVAGAVADVPGCGSVDVRVGVMEPERRLALQDALRATRPTNPFGKDTLTRVLAVASGKGGVGKSSVTANLAVALAARGLAVGLIDADVHGYSIPGLLGVSATPTKLDRMILPPVVRDVKVISIGMFLDADRPVAWRGPMLHRALEQFVTDVHWGDLDVLLVDLPPGTGDIAISTAQLLPASELLVVTTPQHAAAQVAARAGQLAEQTGQTVAGVVENMGPMTLPDGTVLDVFGAGGGAEVAERLSGVLDTQVPLLGTVPLDPALRAGGDAGEPVVVSAPESPAGRALTQIAQRVAVRPRGLAGRRLPVTPR
ncbi:Mrp/NBP35 family ATP-binding protein [Micrococcus luteus]|uniref:Mrp/NBP35 family ATP-binding protein n=1 Tax=Micrococcus luteus TaxID=1270 RepID=UPI00080DFB21|nr:Mrp/NBP35 family ATP-binding protein [Micrococcus luteus]